MKYFVFLKITLGLLLLLPKLTYAIVPPIITATGNQTYCPGTSLKIVETIFITNDPTEPDTEAIYIQISSGYLNGQDNLILANPALHPNITTSWDSAAGKLKLFSPLGTKILYTDFESAIKDIEFNNSSTSPSGTRNFSITIGQANYLPSTGHYYQYVPNVGITWTNAKIAAEALNYYGLQGYLATLLSLEEAKLSGEQASGAGWIGGSDVAVEGEWRWVTGPEGLANGGTGIVFWNGTGSGSTPNFAYWNTSNNEPNNLGDEDYAHITAPGIGIPGSWNDLSNTGSLSPGNAYQPKGFIVEYGGMAGDPILQISASTTITIPRIETTTPATRCGNGSVTLQATASNGTVNWYNNPISGTSIFTGNSFATPNLTTTTNYYVDASNGNCPNGPRTEITATVNTTPSITSTASAPRCDSGTVTLGATASAGTINWYDAPSGGISLATGNSFTTPNLTSTTTYYVDATATGCTTPTRTPIIATVNFSPTITTTTPAPRCDSGTVTLGATASAGTINWYDVPTGGTSIATGNTYTTPILSATTTYYVDAIASGCTTPTRAPVIATINISPSITGTPNSRCDSGSVTLAAVASSGTINWHDAPIGGTLLGTGTLFATPNLTTTTTYYVDATASGCTTASRTLVTATINTTPTITSTIPDSRCASGTVTLGATASSGTINWYDVSSGGTSLAVGNSFTTPSLTASKTYYVHANVNGCISPRIPVTATVYPVISLSNEVVLCQSTTATLTASLSGMDYFWSPGGETTQSIDVSDVGEYTVIISSPLANCDSKEEFKVIEHPEPIIKEIVVVENSLTIELENPENYYEFSIDGELFVDFNQFSRIPSGQYTAFVRDKNGCNLVPQDFSIFSIAKYFTPNNDGLNDLWEIKEMQNFPNSSVAIFNRYGKLLKQINYGSPGWNGTFNSVPLPADDYWYVLKLEDSKPEIKGHFSLKR
jgi:gliding motility-associated-like protein